VNKASPSAVALHWTTTTPTAKVARIAPSVPIALASLQTTWRLTKLTVPQIVSVAVTAQTVTIAPLRGTVPIVLDARAVGTAPIVWIVSSKYTIKRLKDRMNL
jgi:hypothetical protein